MRLGIVDAEADRDDIDEPRLGHLHAHARKIIADREIEFVDASGDRHAVEQGLIATAIGIGGVSGAALLGLVTVERDLGILRNPQLTMSQGMFRALALLIHLNLAIFSHEKRLLLIDDIGEGLDYERATNIIGLVISAAEKEHIQVLMTSNDRFVMNHVPLDHWIVFERTERIVKAFTPKTSPKVFEDFKFIGLSNFDFFKDTRFH